MYELKSYSDLNSIVNPANIIYSLENFHNLENSAESNLESASKVDSTVESTVETQINGYYFGEIDSCTQNISDDEILAIGLRQNDIIKRINAVKSKLKKLQFPNVKPIDSNKEAIKHQKVTKSKTHSVIENSSKLIDNKIKELSSPSKIDGQNLKNPPFIKHSITACASPKMVNFENSEKAIKELQDIIQLNDIVIAIDYTILSLLHTLFNVSKSRQNITTFRCYHHSSMLGKKVDSNFGFYDKNAPISITVILKNDSSPVSIFLPKSPAVGYFQVLKNVGRLYSIYPEQGPEFAVEMTSIDYWLEKAEEYLQSTDDNDLIERQINRYLGENDFLSSPDGVSLSDVIFFAIFKQNVKNYPSNLENWLERCKLAGLQ